MAHSQKPPNCPHKLTKTAEPWLGGEPPRAARTARGRHAGCSSLLPLHVSRGSRRAAQGGRHGGRFLQLRVSLLAGRAGTPKTTGRNAQALPQRAPRNDVRGDKRARQN